jgi:hypothetical protein
VQALPTRPGSGAGRSGEPLAGRSRCADVTGR